MTYCPSPTNGVVSFESLAAPFLDEGEVVETSPGCALSIGRDFEIPALPSSTALFPLQLLPSAISDGAPSGTVFVVGLLSALIHLKYFNNHL